MQQANKHRVLIECTPTYSTNLLTGIQRVVRSILQASQSIDDVEIIPFIIVNGQLYAIQAPEDRGMTSPNKGLVASLLSIQFFIRFKDKLRRYASPIFTWLKHHYLHSRSAGLVSEQTPLLDIKPEDVILMLDSSWARDDITQLQKLSSSKQAHIVYVLYDLIPVIHPEYCNPLHTKTFKAFITECLLNANTLGIIGISQAVMRDFQRYAGEHYPKCIMPKLDFFHLGVDKHRFVNGDVRQSVKELFDNKRPTFLMVSTIEPRKNHTYLLDCFEQLWQQGVEVNLLFIGKVGWEVAPLMKRINNHSQRNQQFFVMHDANDAELAYAYEHSTALVFPSHAEGFGLPIIEALEHGLPVIASDIPVHKEVGGYLAMYINTSTTESLVNLVKSIVAEGIPLAHQPHDYKWLNWEASAQQLIGRVLAMRKNA